MAKISFDATKVAPHTTNRFYKAQTSTSTLSQEKPKWFFSLSEEHRSELNQLPANIADNLYTLGDDGFNNNLVGTVMSVWNHFSLETIKSIILAIGSHYRRPVTEKEIDRAIDRAKEYKTGKNIPTKWINTDHNAIAEIIKNSSISNIGELQAKYHTSDEENVLCSLFRPDDLVCIAVDKKQSQILTFEELSKYPQDPPQFIVPASMKGLSGFNKEGKPSIRCNDNVLNRKCIIVEFDNATLEKQAALIDHLAQFAPLFMAVHSGNKSIHAWFVCVEEKEADLLDFMRYAVKVGADRSMWTKSQLTRMPNGMRDTGEKQEVLIHRPFEAKEETWDFASIKSLLGSKIFPKTTTYHELATDFPEPPEPVINKIIGVGEKAMIAGSSKAGKTITLINLAKAVSEGTQWLGFQCFQGKVLYLNFELSPARLRERLSAMGGVNENVDFLNFRGSDVTWEWLKKNLEEIKGSYKLIILDPIYKMLGDLNENDNSEVAKLLNHIEQIATRMGAATIFAHHFSKGNKAFSNQLDRASGAGTWARDPDAIITMTDHKDDNHIVVEATLRNFSSPKPSVWEFSYPHFLPVTDKDPSELRGGKDKKPAHDESHVINALEKAGQPIARSNLRSKLEQELSISRDKAYKLIKATETGGLIEEIEGEIRIKQNSNNTED